jgi:hypothetical protein
MNEPKKLIFAYNSDRMKYNLMLTVYNNIIRSFVSDGIKKILDHGERLVTPSHRREHLKI